MPNPLLDRDDRKLIQPLSTLAALTLLPVAAEAHALGCAPSSSSWREGLI
jgi:hypothetical protein